MLSATTRRQSRSHARRQDLPVVAPHPRLEELRSEAVAINNELRHLMPPDELGGSQNSRVALSAGGHKVTCYVESANPTASIDDLDAMSMGLREAMAETLRLQAAKLLRAADRLHRRHKARR